MIDNDQTNRPRHLPIVICGWDGTSSPFGELAGNVKDSTAGISVVAATADEHWDVVPDRA